MPSAVATPVPDACPSPPDWQALGQDIPCPLCRYNLRGLLEPRCPECGYRFEWAEVLDAERREHAYLFEHHPERNVWSFFATLVGGLRPRGFWSSLKPSQPSRAGRLAGYAVLAALPMLAALGVFCVALYIYFRRTGG